MDETYIDASVVLRNVKNNKALPPIILKRKYNNGEITRRCYEKTSHVWEIEITEAFEQYVRARESARNKNKG